VTISFSSFGEFLRMGGYAFYVWTAYGIVVIVLIGNLVAASRRRRRLLKELERGARRSARRGGRPSP